MKYIRTYETEEKFLTDKDSTSRVFRLKPTLYKYSEAGDHVHLELDDPRKHGDSTYIEITLDPDTEFSFYISNKPGDTQTTMNCSIDWDDGTVETKTITADDKGFKLSHSYVAGNYSIELYGVERDYIVIGDAATASGEPETWKCLISHPSSVKRVVLGSNVASIGTFAFTRCHSLTSIYIPNSVTSIGLSAFAQAPLTSIYIPNSVTSIGANVFGGCTALTSIYISNNITSIETSTFIDCISLTSVYIPRGVNSIGNQAFFCCSSLKSIYIPESVNSIGDQAFVECTSLTSIHIPESVNSIETYAFWKCTSLTSINIPRGVASIGEAMFMNCSSLTSIDISEGVNSIGFGAFYGCSSLRSIHIPESVTSIGTSAFCNCPLLSSVNIPENVNTIETYAFYGCSSLTSIDIPEGVTGIGEGVFGGCSSLTSTHIPESVTSIGKEAFKGCSVLSSISSFNTTAPTLTTTDSEGNPVSVFDQLPVDGILHIKPGATGYDAWLSKLPSGWTIVEDL